MRLNDRSLIGKLNDSARAALEGALGLALSRTHYDVEVEHYLMKLLDSSDGDFACIAKHFGIDKSRLAAELTRSLDKLKSGNARTPSVSPTVRDMMVKAWTIGSIDFGAAKVRTGFTILALVHDEELARLSREVSKELQKIQADALRKDFMTSWPARRRMLNWPPRLPRPERPRARVRWAARRPTSISSPST